jgi:hypothetical protein
MARVRKVPLVKGEQRLKIEGDYLAIVQSLYCGECDSLTQAATIQIGKATADREGLPRIIKIGVACRKEGKHKDGMKYLWPSEGWIIPRQ